MKRFLIFALLVPLLCFSTVLAQKKKTKSKKEAATTSISKIEKEVLEEINSVRSNPQNYINFLNKLKKGMRNKILYLPNGKMSLMNEGVSAINDAIGDLKKVSKLRPINLSNDLSEVAGIQLNDLKQNVTLGHDGKDGSDLATRISRVGKIGNLAAENISYNATDAQSIVLTMIIDDGVVSRLHRKNILNNRFTQIGIAHGKGQRNMSLCVLVFADSFTKGTGGARIF